MQNEVFQGNPFKHTESDRARFLEYAGYFEDSPLPTTLKLSSFVKYVRRQDISRFLAKNELFKLQLDVPGVVIECGCYAGAGIMTYAQLSSIYEPYNHQRRIYGFDTFSGFPSVGNKDTNTDIKPSTGDLFVNSRIVEEIQQSIRLHDGNRALNHIPKTELVIGDATETIPQFLQDNQHIIVSLLYLDFDLYAPTKVSLELLLDRMPKGAVLAFDEINTKNYPGETVALQEVVGLKNMRLKKTPFDPYISYAVIE